MGGWVIQGTAPLGEDQTACFERFMDLVQMCRMSKQHYSCLLVMLVHLSSLLLVLEWDQYH